MKIELESNIYEQIKKKCEDLKISVDELCYSTGVKRSSLQRWKKGNPGSILTLNKLVKKLEELGNESV